MLINTTLGEMEDTLLSKTEGQVDNEDELTTWVEYRFNEELVHRSAHVRLKKMPVFTTGAINIFG